MRIEGVEFYRYNSEVWYRYSGKHEMLTENSDEIIDYMMNFLVNRCTEAYNALCKIYVKVENIRLKRFWIVSRFVRCNFGIIDQKLDIDNDESVNFEFVQCPLRGECKYENVVCNPTFNSKVSETEKQVLKLVFEGYSIDEISDRLCRSPYTIRNHISNSYVKLGVHSKAEFMDYAHKNKMF